MIVIQISQMDVHQLVQSNQGGSVMEVVAQQQIHALSVHQVYIKMTHLHQEIVFLNVVIP